MEKKLVDFFGGGVASIYGYPHILGYDYFNHIQMLEDATAVSDT